MVLPINMARVAYLSLGHRPPHGTWCTIGQYILKTLCMCVFMHILCVLSVQYMYTCIPKGSFGWLSALNHSVPYKIKNQQQLKIMLQLINTCIHNTHSPKSHTSY